MDLDSASVDGGLCRYGYMLMADPAAALAETRRVLRPGGRLALAVWGPAERNPFFALVAMSLAPRGHIPPPDPEGPGIFSMASRERTTALLERAGLQEVRTDEVPARFAFGDVDEYLGFIGDGRADRGGASSFERGAARRRSGTTSRRRPRRFATEDGYVLPGVSLAAVAR